MLLVRKLNRESLCSSDVSLVASPCCAATRSSGQPASAEYVKIWTKEEGGSGADFIRSCAGDPWLRLPKVMGKLEAALNRSSSHINLTRVPVRMDSGAPAWIGKVDLLGETEPHGLSGFAAPAVLASKELGWRFGHHAVPYPGIGAFYSALQGDTLVLAWPMKAVVTEQAAAINAINDLFEALSPAEAAAFMKKAKAVHFPLREGEAVWLPYGWYVSTVGLGRLSFVLQVPWFASALLQMLPDDVKKGLIQWNVGVLEDEAQAADTDDAAQALAHSALCWLKGELA